MPSQTDLDQGGTFRQWSRRWLGPSVGWIDVAVNNIYPIEAAGAYSPLLGITLIPVNANGAVTINLWDPIEPSVSAATLSGDYVNLPLTIVDIGGFAGAQPITINAPAGRTINGQASIQIDTAYGSVSLLGDLETGDYTSVTGGNSSGIYNQGPLFVSVAAIQASFIPVNIDIIQTASYYEGNNAGGAQYFRVAVEPTHGGKVQSADGAWWELDTSNGVFLMQWGAYGDADSASPHDDTTAINLALDYIRTQFSSTLGTRKYFLDGQSRIYRHLGSLNATLIRSRDCWGIINLRLDSRCTGKVALDLTGSRFGHLENIKIVGDQTNKPYSGIQFCRFDAGGGVGPAAGLHRLINVKTDGYFSYTAFHNYASEVNTYLGCDFWNAQVTDGSNEAWAGIMDQDGTKTCISDFTTPVTGARAFNSQLFLGCTFEKNAVDGPALYTQGITNHHYLRCYWVSRSSEAVVVDLRSESRDLILDGHFETTGLKSIVRFTGTGATVGVIKGLTVRDHNPHCEDQVFNVDTLTSVTIYNLNLYIPKWDTTPSVGVFSNPAKFSVYNSDLTIPTLAILGTVSTFLAFQGRVFGMDQTQPTNYGGQTYNGIINSTNTTQATSASTGAIITLGGFGAAKNIVAGGILKSFDTTEATALNTGSLIALGGASFSKALWIGGLLRAAGAIRTTDTTASTSSTTGALISDGGAGIAGSLFVGGNIGVIGSFLSTSPTLASGYGAGAGSGVTQSTNRTTGVTINTPTGRITTNNTSLAAGATARFTVTCAACASAADVPVLAIRSGTTTDQTDVKVQEVAAGSFVIVVANRHAATAETGNILINYVIHKGSQV